MNLIKVDKVDQVDKVDRGLTSNSRRQTSNSLGKFGKTCEENATNLFVGDFCET